MRQDCPDVRRTVAVLHLHDQAVFVPADIENRVGRHIVCTPESRPQFVEVGKVRLAHDPVLFLERAFRIRVVRPELHQPGFCDDIHACGLSQIGIIAMASRKMM